MPTTPPRNPTPCNPNLPSTLHPLHHLPPSRFFSPFTDSLFPLRQFSLWILRKKITSGRWGEETAGACAGGATRAALEAGAGRNFNSTPLESGWNPTGIGLESDWNPTGIGLESDWNPTGIRLESGWNSTGIRLESDWNSAGIRLEFDWNRVDWINGGHPLSPNRGQALEFQSVGHWNCALWHWKTFAGILRFGVQQFELHIRQVDWGICNFWDSKNQEKTRNTRQSLD